MAVSRSLSSASAGQADDRDVAGLGILFEAAHHFPTVIDRHFEAHQNDFRALGHGQLVTLLNSPWPTAILSMSALAHCAESTRTSSDFREVLGSRQGS
jgi:hypothetical protein